jgi:hypothetical protein
MMFVLGVALVGAISIMLLPKETQEATGAK